eukprot:GCRY01004519.1.p1 GENE.GCRY01004519.1~~GCRY01004519.1.p1  ORF type:complete len:199 (+),score=35.97 GCRY01004519.1:58-654(+)
MPLKLFFEEGSLVCGSALVEGDHDVIIKKGTVIHPRAVIKATNGPVIIGEGNNICELCQVVNNLPPSEDGTPVTMTIGNNNSLDIGCVVHSKSIGSFNNIGVNAFLDSGSIVGDSCHLTPGSHLAATLLPSYSVLTAGGAVHSSCDRATKDVQGFLHNRVLAILHSQLPKHHRTVRLSSTPVRSAKGAAENSGQSSGV